MQIKSLEIGRHAAYQQNAGQLYGQVELTGPNGAMTVHLTPPTLSAIFSLIKAECQRVAQDNAREVARAIASAEAEPLLHAATTLEITSDE